MTCCATSPLLLVDCDGPNSVAILALAGFGLNGTLPASLASGLPQLTALALDDNAALAGMLPDGLGQLPHMLWVSAQNTSLGACTASSTAAGAGSSGSAVAAACSLGAALAFSTSRASPNATATLACALPQLASALQYVQGMTQAQALRLTDPLPRPALPGAVISSGALTGYFNCTCTVPQTSLTVAAGVAQCVAAAPGGSGDSGNKGLLVAVIVVAIVPPMLFILGIYVFFK